MGSNEISLGYFLSLQDSFELMISTLGFKKSPKPSFTLARLVLETQFWPCKSQLFHQPGVDKNTPRSFQSVFYDLYWRDIYISPTGM